MANEQNFKNVEQIKKMTNKQNLKKGKKIKENGQWAKPQERGENQENDQG